MACAAVNGERKALIHAVYHGRDVWAKHQCAGMLATGIPVFLCLDRCPDKEAILQSVREQLDFGAAHCNYPYAILHPQPIVHTVLYNYQQNTMELGAFSAITAEEVRIKHGQNGMIVTGMIDQEGAPVLTWYIAWSGGWYSNEYMQRFRDAFLRAAAFLKGEQDAADL